MDIYLIRHGESVANRDKKEGNAYFCGQLDVPLTETGVAGAQALQAFFDTHPVEEIYCSDLVRTQQTATHIFGDDIAPVITPTLRERSLGVFEGKPKSILQEDPVYEKYFNDPQFNAFRHDFVQKAPEGESYQDVVDRVADFFDTVLSKEHDAVAIVAHQVVIRCMLYFLGHISKEEALEKEIKNTHPYHITLN